MTDNTWDGLAGNKLKAPVGAVVVLEDRAQVTRKATAQLEAGTELLAVTGVTPVVADRTLRCRVRPVEGGSDEARVVDLRVERRYIVRVARPEKEKEITEAIEQLADEYREVYDAVRGLLHERSMLNHGTKQLISHVRDRLGLGEWDTAWPEELRDTMGRRSGLEDRILAQQWDQEDRELEMYRLHEELAAALQPVSEYQAALITEVAVETAGRYEIEWEYLVPCALWRPAYTAELKQKDDGGARVHWTSNGTVWQATGEDWTGIELSFSTARPTLGAELPLLHDDMLSSREKTEEEKKTIHVTSRDEIIATTESAPEKQSDTPPGLDDGGEARTFTVPEKVDVPSDARPHRITFETWDTDADSELLCLPERAAYVFVRSLQPNPSAMPLLAGPVSLVKNGGYVGRSSIRYVAPQERFALSWGSEDGLVVLRDVVRDYEEKGMVSKQHHHRFKVKVYLVNHSGSEAALRLVERVPVSEIEQVKIEIEDKGTTPSFDKDEQGHLSWKRTLAPGAEDEVRLAFEVVMPSNVHWDG